MASRLFWTESSGATHTLAALGPSRDLVDSRCGRGATAYVDLHTLKRSQGASRVDTRDRSVLRIRRKAGDTSRDGRGRVAAMPPILQYGFRPFFFSAALYAAFAVPFWVWTYVGGPAPEGAFTGVAWHAHEMIFGYLGAVLAGFILTAVPNWTGRLPLSGWPLAGLVGLWLAGRLA